MCKFTNDAIQKIQEYPAISTPENKILLIHSYSPKGLLISVLNYGIVHFIFEDGIKILKTERVWDAYKNVKSIVPIKEN